VDQNHVWAGNIPANEFARLRRAVGELARSL
jgi:hypothetical protein